MTDIIEFDHGIRLSHGDCRDMLAGLPEGCADACVTDPPYEINFMNRAFDRTGIAFDPEFWRLVYRALKPGGHVLAFSASRTYHRMACAVEDAGFEIRDQIDWIYGSGMPHGSDAARLVDDRLGVERRVTGTYTTRGTGYRSGGGFGVSATNGGDAPREWDVTEATSDEAKRWDGWNTALKPAHEPIVLARKPLDGCLADNLKDHGCGALHVDACRVPLRGEDDRAKAVPGTVRVRDNKVYNRARPSPPYDADARFPPDVLLDPAAADVLDAQSGVTASRKGRRIASDGEAGRADALAGPSGRPAGRAGGGAVRRFGRDPAGVRHGGRALRGRGDGRGLHTADPRAYGAGHADGPVLGGSADEAEQPLRVDERAARRGLAVGERPVAHEPVDVAGADAEDARRGRHVGPAVDRLVRVQWDAGGVHGVVGADERDPSGRMVRGEAEVVDVAEAAIQEFREFCGTVEYGHADDGHDRAYASARHADLRVGRGCV